MHNGPWLSADVQARIETPLITLIEADLEEQKATNIIKVEIWRNLSQATLETYKFNMYNFDDGQPEECLALLRNWKIATDGNGTTSPSGRIIYLRTLLYGSSFREFN